MQCSPARILMLVKEGMDSWTKRANLILADSESNPAERGLLQNPKMAWAIGKPLTTGHVTLLVDAAWKGIQKRKNSEWGAGVGWQGERTTERHIRDSMRICATSALQAECIEIWEGMKSVAGMSKNILIKTNCQVAIKALSNPKFTDNHIRHVLADIIALASTLDYVSCVKVDRLTISPAHILATNARKGMTV
ncbi:hypothetical protein SOVF_101740 [Spinacia oleracea]|nr:hypothetical protein SOVF_101740 [Spinacia oleracea]